MTIIARVDETELTSNDLIKYLKINNKFDQIVEDMITDHLTAVEAPKLGVQVSDNEIQQEADQVRRALGLHRAQDTLDFLDGIGLTVEDFEQTLSDSLLRRKAVEIICSEKVLKDHFDLHSPKYETVEISRIVIDSEGKAREAMALLEDEPEEFARMAMELSLDKESAAKGGRLGKVSRGELQSEMEAKVFNSAVGEVLGPFEIEDGRLFEIYRVTARHPPLMDLPTTKMITKQIYDRWVDERLQEHHVEIL